MLLKEHLEEYTKEQLLEQARSFELRKCLGLRKAALIERILECFCYNGTKLGINFGVTKFIQ